MHINSTYFLTSPTEGILKGAFLNSRTYIEEEIFFPKKVKNFENEWKTLRNLDSSPAINKRSKNWLHKQRKWPIHLCLPKEGCTARRVQSWPSREKQNHSRVESKPQSTQSLEWPLSGVHSITTVKSALRGGGGGGVHTLHLSLYLPSRAKFRCRLQLRGQILPPVAPLPLYVLCGLDIL